MDKIDKQNLLKNFLIAFNLDQTTFAMIMSMNKVSISYWILGKREIPDHVAKLLNMFLRNPDRLNEFY